MCGGTRNLRARRVQLTGLSPRVRGNLPHALDSPVSPRSIPACAGEPRSTYRTGLTPSVYPRVCGGTHTQIRRAVRRIGLSPRVRGNRRAGQGEAWHGRSIPACAGEPFSLITSAIRSAVYPRVCGGTVRATFRLIYARGLSPRVRGNPLRRALRGLDEGSIPACAGEPGTLAA